MLLVQPYQPGRIPVVLVHGTVSSPVAWAEMVNTLRNDPVLRKRYQFWFYEYTSNAPIVSSAAILRETLTKMVERLDPEHKDPAMSEMVIIGHSQGGLLTNLMAVDSGNRFWRVISDQSFESLDVDPLIKANMSKALFFKSLPFVKHVIYISTPHRGSFLTKDWVRNLSRRLMTLPIDLVKGGGAKFAQLSGQVKMPPGLNDKLPTSIDGMTPGNPMMKALVESPLAPGVIDNSIIAVLPGLDIKTGNDGVVEYSSAHIDNVESEYIVRSGHSVQGHPLAIEEVRRILLKHLNQK
jgi:triacylglycerol esterase/lipase EstA (alpha/beta hydrolase family)